MNQNILQPQLRVKNLTFEYRQQNIFSEVTFDLFPGELMVVIGPNGGGKSTLLRCLAAHLRPTSGEIFWENNLVRVLPPSEISLVPQMTQINEQLPLTTYEMIEMGILNTPHSPDTIMPLLSDLGLEPYKNKLFRELSGGLKQRVLLARSLAKRPKLLLFDEPLQGLDLNAAEMFFATLQKILTRTSSCEFPVSVIMVEHHLDQMLPRASKILCLDKIGHWHENPQKVTKEVLKGLYQCELEHVLFHQHGLTHHPSHSKDSP